MKTIHVAAAIIQRDGKIMIAKRGYGPFKGLYEFPGGKLEPGETAREALKRELQEELHANIAIERFFYHAHYLYPDFILEMDCYLCHLLDDHLTLLEHLDYRWIEPQTSHDDIQWVPADRQVIEEIQKQGL